MSRWTQKVDSEFCREIGWLRRETFYFIFLRTECVIGSIFSLNQLTQEVSEWCDFHFPFYSKRLDTFSKQTTEGKGHLNLRENVVVTTQTQTQAVAFLVTLVLKNTPNLLKGVGSFQMLYWLTLSVNSTVFILFLLHAIPLSSPWSFSSPSPVSILLACPTHFWFSVCI